MGIGPWLTLSRELGVPIGVAARMQINIIFEGVLNISQFENISHRIYFPVLWFSETAEPGDDIVSQLKLVLKTIPIIMNVFSFFMVAVGSFLVLSAFVLSILYALGKVHGLAVIQPIGDSNKMLMQGQELVVETPFNNPQSVLALMKKKIIEDSSIQSKERLNNY
ncbi:scavenger receptor class B member 1 [Trichonephila clavipes]|nr:scavenger receptor class B member 1 [Trichonephila clavipes]